MDNVRDDLLLFSKIRAVRSSLSSKEQLVADYVLTHPHRIADETALQIAEAAGTSNATVVRFCRSCGFTGLTELKFYLQREILTSESTLNAIAQTDSVAVIKQKVRSYHEAVLRNIVATPDENSYEAAANAIVNAGQVLIAGVGGSLVAAYTFMDTFLNLGVNCAFYSDPVISTYKASLLGPDDVLMVVMYTGSFTLLINEMAKAKENGATVILLCGVPDSPADKHADIILRTSVIPPEHTAIALSVRVAEMMIIEILYALVEKKQESRGIHSIEIDRTLDIHRVPGKWPPPKKTAETL